MIDPMEEPPTRSHGTLRFPRPALILAIIGIEGFIVLGAELLTIRSLAPYVGQDAITTAIIVTAVLLPLALGYHVGGQARARALADGRRFSVRRRLATNFLIAGLVFAPGLGFAGQQVFFDGLSEIGLKSRLGQTILFSALFLVYPTFLLAQTTPLCTHYLRGGGLARTTGRVLFIGTIGSFLGGTVTVLVLMPLIGLPFTAALITLLSLALMLLVANRRDIDRLALAGIAAAITLAANHPILSANAGIVADNAYHRVQILELDNPAGRLFSLNRNFSSFLPDDPADRFGYVSYLEDRVVPSLSQPADILVIGAAGHTMGRDDTINRYTFIDIDPELKEIAEQQFLKQPLGPNKRAITAPARHYVRSGDTAYDLIVVDAFTSRITIPAHLVTVEFWLDIRARLADNGRVFVNVITDHDFTTRFSRSFHRSFAQAFPLHDRVPMPDHGGDGRANIIYLGYTTPSPEGAAIYSDRRNREFYDRPDF